MRAALLIAGKDVRQRLRDRSALLLAIVLPLVLASIFGLIFHDVVGGHVSFAFGLVDRDRGTAARAFEAQALRPLERSGLVVVHREASVASARRGIEQDRLSAAFVLPPGLTAAVRQGRPVELRVLGNVDAQIGSQVARSIARTFGGRIDAQRLTAALLGTARGAVPAEPIAIEDVSTTSRQLDAATYYAAGMAVFFLFFTVQFGITSILAERRGGTLARLLVAPVHHASVFAGKLLTSLALGIASMTVLALATHFLLGAHWGNPVGVAILIVTGVVAVTALTALIATLARTAEQAEAWQTIAAIVLGMLGGAFFPVAQAGGLLAALSLATPQAWFLRGIQNLAGGAGPSAALGPAAAMLLFAAAAGSVVFVRSGRLVAP